MRDSNNLTHAQAYEKLSLALFNASMHVSYRHFALRHGRALCSELTAWKPSEIKNTTKNRHRRRICWHRHCRAVFTLVEWPLKRVQAGFCSSLRGCVYLDLAMLSKISVLLRFVQAFSGHIPSAGASWCKNTNWRAGGWGCRGVEEELI